MTAEEKKYPKITAGVTIINQAGKFFFVRSERFNKLLHVPGGHIDWGETIEAALIREVREETGLTIYDLVLIRPVEFIFYSGYDTHRHIISLGYVAKTNDPEAAVVLDGREAEECVWLTEEEIEERDDIELETRKSLQLYFDHKKKEQQCAEYKSGWQRAVADYKNLQKETQERRQLLLEISEQQILSEFLPVYDNFKKAFSVSSGIGDNTNAPQGATNDANKEWLGWKQGIGHIMKQFGDILKQHKVEEIKTVGEKFDPKFHETVGEEDSDKEHGVILKEVDGGYTMGGRVVKAAKVIISKSK